MPSLYTENSEKWKALADIDYFTQFVKAWIPFNAWYRNYYPSLRTDRDAINEIKTNPNSFRDRLLSLLADQGNDGVVFRSHIAQLHHELGRKYIYNSGERISFENIVVEINTKTSETHSERGCRYRVERGIASRPAKEIEAEVINGVGRTIFIHVQPNGFNLVEIETHTQFLRLTPNQQINLKRCYEEINPKKSVNLLSRDPDDCIEMDNYRFITDRELICKATIEILYKLRNGLFHGEIVPDKDTNKVYEPAYHILYMLIQAL